MDVLLVTCGGVSRGPRVATVRVPVMLSPEEVAAIDRARGMVPRSVWMKAVCAAEVQRLEVERSEGPSPGPRERRRVRVIC